MPSDRQRADAAELAALYAAGALTPDEQAEFDARVVSGDAECATELSSHSQGVEALADSTARVSPPEHIRETLLSRIQTPAPARVEDEPFFVQKEEQGTWEDIGIPGARIRMLFVDRERKVKTFLIRMEPGCEVPLHPHGDAEECYVIEGDLHTAGRVLGPGDYMRAPAGSLHGRSFTRGGCLCLVTAGLEEHEMN